MVLITPSAFAALIYGSVYDLDLKPVSNIIVEVNTSPIQRYLARDGNYSFTIPLGTYQIRSQHQYQGERFQAEEVVNIIDNGVYVLDLFLFPDISEDTSLFEPTNITFSDPDKNSQKGIGLLYLLVGILIVAGAVILYVLRKNKDKPQLADLKPDYTGKTDYSKKIVHLLKQNDRRLTQKEIRKKIPLSEAKISLLITELESQDKVQRIKKGRGNIIILK